MTIAKSIVDSEQFVKEPVEKEVNDILNLDTGKIILTGGRGVGKSTVLYRLQKEGIGTKEQTIGTSYSAIIIGDREPSEKFDDKMFDHYYELLFTRKILHYISENYPEICEKHFASDIEFINSLFKDFDTEYNNSLFKIVSFKHLYETKELSANILNKFRDICEIEKLNLTVDGFDSANGSSEYVQNIFQRYFDMFDKVVLAVNDTNLDDKRLNDEGYAIRKLSYGNDKEILKEIIKRRESLYLVSDIHSGLLMTAFTTDSYLDKLTKLDGNIDMAISALMRVAAYLDVYRETNTLDEILDMQIAEAKEFVEIINEKSYGPKCYL